MKPVLVYNWKTYITTTDDAVALIEAFESADTVEAVVCPSALHTLAIAESARKKNIALGAQDISVSADTPQTGNLSGAQLTAVGISHSIVGHKETRTTGVTNAMVAEKILHAITAEIVPIICLSEQNDDAQDDSEEIVEQLEEIVQSIASTLQKESDPQPRLIIAYEPAAYIGANDALAPEKIKHIVDLLREVVQRHGLHDVPIIYGGAVNSENAEGIIDIAGVDGFLLGRASTNAETANTILRSL